ncbi:MAG TPA: DUF1839 family protein [Rhizobacter sp.]
MKTPARACALPGLSPEAYARHGLHGEQCTWVEKNCYADVWIELLHCLQLEPLALMPFTLRADFEGDHWTFFKPPLPDLQRLYGIDVQELNIWRPLIEHAAEHLATGKLISTEADAFWLPDTAGTDYRQQHVKTTIVLNDLDLAQERLGYFHNAGYHWLEGEDFRRTFALDGASPATLPLYAELVRLDRLQRHTPAVLAELSSALLKEHFAWRPADNPVDRFAERFKRELPVLKERGLGHYHAWAFTTVRQLGAAFELAAAYLRWLQPHRPDVPLAAAAEAFERIAQESKALILKGARVVNARREFDPAEALAPTAEAWARGMSLLETALT